MPTVFLIPAPAYATCTNQGKDGAHADYSGYSQQGGVTTKEVIPIGPTLCGTTWNEGAYVSSYGIQFLSRSCAGAYDYLEGGIYKGQSDNGQSSNGLLHYYYIIQTSNYCPIESKSFSDTSAGGTYPSVGDTVNITVRWSKYVFPYDYYKIWWYDLNTGVILIVDNIYVTASNGPITSVQMESFNSNNIFKTSWTNIMYRDASSHWVLWPSSTGYNGNYYAVQPMSAQASWCGYQVSLGGCP